MERFMLVLVALFLLVAWGSLIYGCEECEAKGGIYAKTFGGVYKCIEPNK